MLLNTLPAFISSFLITVPLIITIKNNQPHPKVRLLTFFLVQVWAYMIFEPFVIRADTIESALYWDKIMYVPIILMPATFLHLLMVNLFERQDNRFFYIYLPQIIFISLLPSDLMLSGMKPSWWGYTKTVGEFFIFFRIYFITFFFLSIAIILYRLKKAPSLKIRNEMLWLGISIIPPILAAILVVAILPIFNIVKLNIIFNAAFVTYLSFLLVYSFIKKNLFDLQLLFSPLIKTEKYYIHQRLRTLINNIARNHSIEHLIINLSNLLQCPVTLIVQDRAFSSSQEQCDHSPEFVMPIAYEDKNASIQFGKGFSTKMYSSQDVELITILCKSLSVALSYISPLEEELQKRDERIRLLSKPATIILKDGIIHSVYTAEPSSYFLYDSNSKDSLKKYDTIPYPNKQLFKSLLNG